MTREVPYQRGYSWPIFSLTNASEQTRTTWKDHDREMMRSAITEDDREFHRGRLDRLIEWEKENEIS